MPNGHQLIIFGLIPKLIKAIFEKMKFYNVSWTNLLLVQTLRRIKNEDLKNTDPSRSSVIF